MPRSDCISIRAKKIFPSSLLHDLWQVSDKIKLDNRIRINENFNEIKKMNRRSEHFLICTVWKKLNSLDRIMEKNTDALDAQTLTNSHTHSATRSLWHRRNFSLFLPLFLHTKFYNHVTAACYGASIGKKIMPQKEVGACFSPPSIATRILPHLFKRVARHTRFFAGREFLSPR